MSCKKENLSEKALQERIHLLEEENKRIPQLEEENKKIHQLEEEYKKIQEENKSLMSKLPKRQKKIYPLSIKYVIEIVKGIEKTSVENAKTITIPEMKAMKESILDVIKKNDWKICDCKSNMFKKKKDAVTKVSD